MKSKTYLIIFILFILFTFSSSLYSDIKWIRVNNIHEKVEDNAGQSKGGDIGPNNTFFYYYDNFERANFQRRGWSFSLRNWTDEFGNKWDYFVMGPNMQEVDDLEIEIPQRFPDGSLIKRYYRYQPPSIFVDGLEISEPFPRAGDEINPAKIPGTADILVESVINTQIGLTIHQRVIAFSQKNHDDYIIWDMVWKNTGNVDSDDEIELEGQVLDSLYFRRQFHFVPGGNLGGIRPTWVGYYGAKTTDTLRVIYGYDAWDKGANHDSYGQLDLSTGFIQKPQRIGEAILFVSRSPQEFDVNDPTQPQMTCSNNYLQPHETSGQSMSPEDMMKVHRFHVLGLKAVPEVNAPYIQDPISMGGLGIIDIYPGTHHNVMVEDLEDAAYPEPGESWIYGGWRMNGYYSIGPYKLNFGDSVRVVWADVVGTISPKKAWEIGKAWLNGECTWDGPSKLPPPAQRVYDRDGNSWSAPGYKTTQGVDDNDIAKDNWISTGTDSLFFNTNAAQWAFNHNYEIPIPPPPPEKIEVFSLPDRIHIKWGSQSESAPDFAGYRVYRAKGGTVYSEKTGVVTGDWELIFECGEGTGNPLTHEFDDTTAIRGADYYYSVTAFDDGKSNAPGVKGVSEVLESSMIQCRTTEPASLTKPPSDDLSKIRVVPNPFNVSAQELQFPGTPDKILFVNLPGQCTIRIFNVSGDLIRTIEHTDGSGDHAWVTDTGNQYLTTETGQIVVSGVYIANITTPDGRSTNVKFIIVR